MRRCIIGLTLLALTLAPGASAYHAMPGEPHWPTTTVQVNGGSCGWAKPECRWLKIIDRTGYGTTWQNTVLPNTLLSLSAATGYRFNFSTVRGSRFDLWTQTEPSPCDGPCEGVFHYGEAEALTPPGAVFVGRNAYGADTVTCDNPSVDPDGMFPWTGPQPYCGTNPSHVEECVVGAGSNSGDYMVTFKHEMGHCLGLDHRTGTDGHSIMVGFDEWTAFDAHDRAELDRLYGHVP